MSYGSSRRSIWKKFFDKEGLIDTLYRSESQKDGEPRNQVSEKGFEKEEVWYEMLNISNNFSKI